MASDSCNLDIRHLVYLEPIIVQSVVILDLINLKEGWDSKKEVEWIIF